MECGMFQGGRAGDAKNRSFPFNPREIAFVLLSHAHSDHSGLITRLIARGFTGAVYATRATCDLLEVMLPDAGHLQEKEAQWSGEETALYGARSASELGSSDRRRVRRRSTAASFGCAHAIATQATSSARRSSSFSSPARRSCSPATSASPTCRSSPTRRRSPRPTCCSSSRPTATATTRILRRRSTNSPTR
jgi:hypothetical protein